MSKRIYETSLRWGERVLAAALTDPSLIPELMAPVAQGDARSVVIQLAGFDPSPKHRYLVWIAREYSKRTFLMEDEERVRETLRTFSAKLKRLASLGVNTDLLSYDFRSLEDVIAGLKDGEPDVEVTVDSSMALTLYHGLAGTLWEVRSHAGAIELGRGTRWCTNSQSSNHFDRYHRMGPLYVWRNDKGEKFQFHFETESFMNSSDQPVDFGSLIDSFEIVPCLQDLFERKASTSTRLKLHVESALRNGTPSPEFEAYAFHPECTGFAEGHLRLRYKKLLLKLGGVERYEAFILATVRAGETNRHTRTTDWQRNIPDEVLTYCVKYRRHPWPELERLLTAPKADMYLASAYANRLAPHLLPELRSRFETADISMEDLTGYLKGRQWNDDDALEKILFRGNRIEALVLYASILRSYRGAAPGSYCTTLRVRRWEALEAHMMKQPATEELARCMQVYCTGVLKTRWPEAEPVIALCEKATWKYLSTLDGPTANALMLRSLTVSRTKKVPKTRAGKVLAWIRNLPW